MATGKVLAKIEDDFFEVEISKYKVGMIKRANGFRLDQDRAAAIVQKFSYWLNQSQARRANVESEKNQNQNFINAEQQKPIKPVDPLNPPTESDSFYQDEGAVAYAKARVSELEAIEAELDQKIFSFDEMRSREILRRDSFRLDADRLESGFDQVSVEQIWARDCSALELGDFCLVISLDFDGARKVLDPDPINFDYVAELNQAWLNYAGAMRAAANVGNQIEVLIAWLDAESQKPEMPPFPHKNLDAIKAAKIDLVNTEKGVQYREGLIREYNQKLVNDPESESAGEWASAINTLESEVSALEIELNGLQIQLESLEALPDPQFGQYQDAATIQDLTDQIAAGEVAFESAQSQAGQAETDLSQAKEMAVANSAGDSSRMGYRQLNKINVLAGVDSQSPAQWFTNSALAYGAQKWKPFFITGEVVAVDNDNFKITIKPESVEREVGGRVLDLSRFESDSIVAANNERFNYKEGEKALIKSEHLESFGWAENPGECGDFIMFGQWYGWSNPLPEFFQNFGEPFKDAPTWLGQSWDGVGTWRLNSNTGHIDQYKFGELTGVSFDPGELKGGFPSVSVWDRQSGLNDFVIHFFDDPVSSATYLVTRTVDQDGEESYKEELIFSEPSLGLPYHGTGNAPGRVSDRFFSRSIVTGNMNYLDWFNKEPGVFVSVEYGAVFIDLEQGIFPNASVRSRSFVSGDSGSHTEVSGCFHNQGGVPEEMIWRQVHGVDCGGVWDGTIVGYDLMTKEGVSFIPYSSQSLIFTYSKAIDKGIFFTFDMWSQQYFILNDKWAILSSGFLPPPPFGLSNYDSMSFSRSIGRGFILIRLNSTYQSRFLYSVFRYDKKSGNLDYFGECFSQSSNLNFLSGYRAFKGVASGIFPKKRRV